MRDETERVPILLALVNVLSGVEAEFAPAGQVGIPAAIAALLALAVVPAVIGLLLVQRRDVV